MFISTAIGATPEGGLGNGAVSAKLGRRIGGLGLVPVSAGVSGIFGGSSIKGRARGTGCATGASAAGLSVAGLSVESTPGAPVCAHAAPEAVNATAARTAAARRLTGESIIGDHLLDRRHGRGNIPRDQEHPGPNHHQQCEHGDECGKLLHTVESFPEKRISLRTSPS
ncbi:hypothetical protein [Roseovarius pacificus]|uniref:hypothetical protein n=1 Tax=Roseovarius pacificus TaxID=337701 RepID=UPI0037498E53